MQIDLNVLKFVAYLYINIYIYAYGPMYVYLRMGPSEFNEA